MKAMLYHNKVKRLLDNRSRSRQSLLLRGRSSQYRRFQPNSIKRPAFDRNAWGLVWGK